MKVKHKLDIKNYPSNAANRFSLARLLLYTILSIILTVLLVLTSLEYKGKALVFSSIAFIMIFGYTILNIMALVIKIKNKK